MIVLVTRSDSDGDSDNDGDKSDKKAKDDCLLARDSCFLFLL